MIHVDLIYDVGMNTGQDTEFYLAKGFRVVAIDANPELTESIKDKFAGEIADGRLIFLNVAVAARKTFLPFYVNETYSEWSSLGKTLGVRGGKCRRVMVQAVPLDDIMAEFGNPYYLKLDIEGVDLAALRTLHRVADSPPYVSVETGANFQWLDELRDLHYRWFKLIDQRAVANMICPIPPREGKLVERQFPRGATGPFGEETPGDWLSYDEVYQAWASILSAPGVDNPLWYDFHAKF